LPEHLHYTFFSSETYLEQTVQTMPLIVSHKIFLYKNSMMHDLKNSSADQRLLNNTCTGNNFW